MDPTALGGWTSRLALALRTDEGGIVYTIFVTFQVQAEHRDDFIKATMDDARGAMGTEPGCVRFDILRDEEDPNKVHLYEVYKDKAALDAHGQTPHLLKWRETTKDWRAGPSVVSRGINIYPTDKDWK